MTTSTVQPSVVEGRRLLWVGPLTVVTAVVVNLIVRAIMLSLLPIAPEFPPFGIGAIAAFTAIGTALAVIAFAVVNAVSGRPIRTYWIVAAVAFFVSIIPNLVSAANPNALPMPFPGATTTAFLALIVLHVAAAVVSVGMLTTLTVKR